MNALTCLDNNMFLTEQKVCYPQVVRTHPDKQFGAGDGYLNCEPSAIVARSHKLTRRLPLQLGLRTRRRRPKRNSQQRKLLHRSRHALISLLHTYFLLCIFSTVVTKLPSRSLNDIGESNKTDDLCSKDLPIFLDCFNGSVLIVSSTTVE